MFSSTAHLDGLQRGGLAAREGRQHMLAGDAEGAQAVQDGLVEAAKCRKIGVDVQRVVVAVQAVQSRQVFARPLLYRRVRRAPVREKWPA